MNRKELKQMIRHEAEIYDLTPRSSMIKKCIIQDHDYLLFKYLKTLRMSEYYYNRGNKILFQYYQRKKNKMGASLGITMWHNCIGEGLRIWHYGSVIVNGHAKIGKNCQLHGENCIGNKGDFDKAAPTIGDNVTIFANSLVLGKVEIGNNVIVGANSLLLTSVPSNCICIGSPAIIISKNTS